MIWAADVPAASGPAVPLAGGGAGGVTALAAGTGIGWRPEIAGVVADLPDLAFCEVIAEAIDPASPPWAVEELRARGVPVVPHGVRLSLGGAEAVEPHRVTHLAAAAAALGAPLVSEHVAFVRSGGREAGHLLPVPRTRAALAALAGNVARLQAELDVPLALEPIAALVDWPEDEYTEADFLAALLDRTGAHLLLDVANVHANAVNHGQHAEAVLDALPLDRVAYVHVAGGAVRADGLYHDTHTHPVPAPVLQLLRRLRERLPADAPVLLERDGAYPAAAQLRAEFAAVAAAGPDGTRPGPVAAGNAPARVPAAGPGIDTATLAAAQAGLLDALVAGGPDPPGFDPYRLDATRAALLRKRAGEVAVVWPVLAVSLGERWRAAFAAHAAGRPPAGALRDGWDLARALHVANALGPGAAAELADREAAFRYDGASAPRRRGRLSRALRGR
ncbi:DUF692 family multinuclear iron-containing protein [Pseudonocardia sp.]|uniref:DUF692 domain-containing protein n=1 Tax=Pseudonocardia sp. TaxID=60912 RepID=UPI003D1507E4